MQRRIHNIKHYIWLQMLRYAMYFSTKLWGRILIIRNPVVFLTNNKDSTGAIHYQELSLLLNFSFNCTFNQSVRSQIFKNCWRASKQTERIKKKKKMEHMQSCRPRWIIQSCCQNTRWAALATTPPIKTKTGYIKNQNEAKRLKVKGVVVVPRYHFINRKPKKKKKKIVGS